MPSPGARRACSDVHRENPEATPRGSDASSGSGTVSNTIASTSAAMRPVRSWGPASANGSATTTQTAVTQPLPGPHSTKPGKEGALPSFAEPRAAAAVLYWEPYRKKGDALISSTPLPRMSLPDSAAFLTRVVAPTLAKGVIIRRKAVVGLAERIGSDAKAVRLMQALRAKYGDGPLLVRNPIRPQVVLFRPEDVRRVLEGAPDPFSPASSEKVAALSHFEPHVSLVTRGPERAPRRAFNATVLDSGCPIHRLADELTAGVEEETRVLLRRIESSGRLEWGIFFETWMQIVRRIVLGPHGRKDDELTDMLVRLRRRGNWAFAAPKNRALRNAFHQRLQSHLDRAEPGSLAALIAQTPQPDGTHPSHQVAQWLFAFDPGGMATFRALALLVAHPDHLERAREDIASSRSRADLPYLRAAFVETLRLYPTTPALLRQTTRSTEWPTGMLPEGSGIFIFAPYFHRDDQRLPNAHRFHPDPWMGKDPAEAVPLVPFSAGPAACPARHLVPMIGATLLACLIGSGRQISLNDPSRLDPTRPLPGTLDNYTLSFTVSPDAAQRPVLAAGELVGTNQQRSAPQ